MRGVEVEASFVKGLSIVERDTTVYLDTADDQTRTRIEVRLNFFFVRDESACPCIALFCLSRSGR